jgi:hypothetical protein
MLIKAADKEAADIDEHELAALCDYLLLVSYVDHMW